jgi:hypothetical protein
VDCPDRVEYSWAGVISTVSSVGRPSPQLLISRAGHVVADRHEHYCGHPQGPDITKVVPW